MEKRAIWSVELSPMAITAGLAVVALIGTMLWQIAISWKNSSVSATGKTPVAITEQTGASDNINWQRALEGWATSGAEGEEAPPDPDGISNIAGNVLGTLIGSYTAMKDAGVYTPLQGERIAESVAANLRANVSYRLYGFSDIKTDPDLPAEILPEGEARADASLSRILAYRSDLRIALEPLLENSAYELDVFAYYIETGDKSRLAELQSAAKNYRTAIANVLLVVVPSGAAMHHLDILNALSEFEAVLEKMAANADDPYAVAALLRTFNGAEANMLTSFNALAGYFRNHSNT